MRFAGTVPADMPDPQEHITEELRRLPVPILGLLPQPHLEDWGGLSSQVSTQDGTVDRAVAAVSYTLWRKPDDRSDPDNLATFDATTRRSLDAGTPWPRPRWLIEMAERARYPMLWEAVQTIWYRDQGHNPGVGTELVAHVNHILSNRVHTMQTRGSDTSVAAQGGLVDERSVDRDVPVTIEGAEVAGVRIDTDPYIFGLGADLGADGMLTAAIDRGALPYLTLAFTPRPIEVTPD